LTRTLVARAGALGDLLLLRPALAALDAAGHELHLLSPPAGILLAEDDSRVVAGWLDFDDRGLARCLADPRSAWPGRFPPCDSAFVVSNDADLSAALGRHIPHVLACDPRPPDGVHAADAYAAALGAWAVAPLAAVPTFRPRPSAHEEAAPLLARLPADFVAIHPGSGSSRKNWPAASFAPLAEALSGGLPWLLVEGPADAQPVARLARVAGAVRSGPLSLSALAALLARAGVYVGNDSGVTHLAAAVGAMTVALFGPTEPAQWRPVGPNVRVVAAPGGALDRLGVEEVLRAVRA
jgi:ADP-heptose:LPS heptosyltransferase